MVKFTSECDYASLTLATIMLVLSIAVVIYAICVKAPFGSIFMNGIFVAFSYVLFRVLWKEGTVHVTKGKQQEKV
jgi:hypothetical protein